VLTLQISHLDYAISQRTNEKPFISQTRLALKYFTSSATLEMPLKLQVFYRKREPLWDKKGKIGKARVDLINIEMVSITMGN